MQPVHIDSVDRKILHLLQSEPGINAAAIGDRIGLSQSAVWRRMQGLRDEGIIREQPVKIDREKIGLNTMVFAHVKLTSHGRSNLAAFAEAVRSYPQVLDCYVLLGNVDFLLRIVTEDIKAYEQFFFEKLSQLPGIQEIIRRYCRSRRRARYRRLCSPRAMGRRDRRTLRGIRYATRDLRNWARSRPCHRRSSHSLCAR